MQWKALILIAVVALVAVAVALRIPMVRGLIFGAPASA